MKVSEFVKKVNEKGYMPVVVDQQKAKLKKDLDVKDYLSIKEKKELISDIIDTTILYENGVYKFNGIDQYVTYTMMCIGAYTNLELSDDLEEDYDALCRAGVLTKVISTFEDEYQSVLTLLQLQCDYILADNSVTVKVNKFLDSILTIIDRLTSSLSESVDKFDISRINVNEDDIKKIQEFLSIIK